MSSATQPSSLSGGIIPASANLEATGEQRAAAMTVLRMIQGLHISRAVYVAAELGIADRLQGGPMSSDELARVTACHEPSLYRVLRLLSSLGVFAEHPRRTFSLTVLGERLCRDTPASVRSWAMLAEAAGGLGAFEPIIQTVRTGEPGLQITHGMSGFEFLDRHPDKAAAFQAAMSERTAAFAPTVSAGYDFKQMQTLVDVGGGQGILLAAILRGHGHLQGILFETPSVTAAAEAWLHAAGIASRCQVVTGDFFVGVPHGADGYVLANVLHDWDDSRAVKILANCRRAMADGGRVLIVERLIPDDPAEAAPVLLSDLNMLVVTGGKERTNAEYGELLLGAGLRLGRIQPVSFPYGVIEGLAS